MQNLGQILKRFGKSGIEALPNESQCPKCGYFDLSHPDVQRILLSRRNKDWDPTMIGMAGCKCRVREEAIKARDALRYQQANLPHPLHPKTFENFQPRPGTEDAVKACWQAVERQGPRALCLIGPPGCGKSHLLEAMGRALLYRGRSVRYEFVPTLIDRLRHSHDDDSEQDVAELLAWYSRMDVLLLDDVGSERMTPFGVEKLTELVNTRLTDERGLVITTNHTREELADRVGPRLTSRMVQANPELDEMLVVRLTATDYRR